MELTFAGTGSGKVSLERYFSSFLISVPGCRLLMDAGDGISRALENIHIDFNTINSVLFSHFHPDHLNGISALIIQMKMRKRKIPLQLVAHNNLTDKLKAFLETGYIFKERLGFELNIQGYEFNESFSFSDNLSFEARENSHLKKYEGTFDVYRSGRDKQALVSSGFLFSIENLRLYYTGDIAESEDLYLFQNEAPEILISETTHVELKSLLEALRRQNSIRKAILTHINDKKELESWIGSLGENDSRMFIIAEDGMKIDLGSVF